MKQTPKIDAMCAMLKQYAVLVETAPAGQVVLDYGSGGVTIAVTLRPRHRKSYSVPAEQPQRMPSEVA